MMTETMSETEPYHYAVIGRAIDHIVARAPEQASLDEIAASVGLSPAHFQRVFSQWVGVSPKRYQQYLALDHAKRLLADRHSVLDAAHGSGLSGSGRLHDLFLRWEAMSPGSSPGPVRAWPSPGDGSTRRSDRRWRWAPIAASAASPSPPRAGARRRWPTCGRAGRNADFVEAPERLEGWVAAAFGGDGTTRLHLIGAPFQLKVWEALLQVPSGHVTTYSDIAAAIGSPQGGARGRHGGRAQPGQLADPVSPGAAEGRRARRLSLGTRGQAGDAGLGGGVGSILPA